jgi:hypothetical protein
MRWIVAATTIFLCSGCATSRTVTYEFYPRLVDVKAFPRFAERECAKYGMRAVFVGGGSSDYGRLKSTYKCEP